MWKRIRTTLLILLSGTLIGILIGNLSVPHGAADRSPFVPSLSVPGSSGSVGERQEVNGASYASGSGTSEYSEPVAIELADSETVSSSVYELQEWKEESGLTEAAVAARMESERGHYCYDMLGEDLKKLYVEILMILEGHLEQTLVSAGNTEDLQTAFLCVFQDHPEIYWYDGYYYRRYENSFGALLFAFGGRYTHTAEECAQYETGIGTYIRDCLRGIPANADQYEIVKHIYEYVILHTDYVLDSADSQNILSVMIHGESVCQGYAKAVQYLCQEAGVPATLVTGRVFGDSEGHAWDLVKIDGGYYYLDATWGDAGYRSSHGELTEGEQINYQYLNVTSEDLEGTHFFENPVPMPYCVSMDANYFVREGLYLSGYDTVALQRIFEQAASDGTRSVNIKMSDAETYRTVRDRLIEGREIRELIPGDSEQISYREDAGLHLLTFFF